MTLRFLWKNEKVGQKKKQNKKQNKKTKAAKIVQLIYSIRHVTIQIKMSKKIKKKNLQ